jgi:hypothetical protein
MITVQFEAIKALSSFMEVAPEITPQAASLAMNTIIPRKGMVRYRKAIRSQVAFPGGYVEDEDKFRVSRLSTPGNLELAITARQRPTSLARFASGGAVGSEGVTIRVKPGASVRLKKAFLVRLNQGITLTNESFNVGVAVRLKGGAASMRNKTDNSKMVRFAKDVFLLYGPSVDQVFKTVSVTETPHVLNEVETEFYRQFARLA